MLPLSIISSYSVEPLTREEELDLCAWRDSGNTEARDTLIRSGIFLAINIASKACKNTGRVEDDELFSVAFEGLIHAAKLYDAKKSKFTTYATIAIKRHIQRYVHSYRYPVRTPMYFKDITLEEIESNKPTDAYKKYLRLRKAEWLNEERATLRNKFRTYKYNPVLLASVKEDAKKSKELVKEIKEYMIYNTKNGERNFEVFRLRHVEGLKLKEIGEVFGITRERARQIIVDVTAVLQKQFRPRHEEIEECLLKTTT